VVFYVLLQNAMEQVLESIDGYCMANATERLLLAKTCSLRETLDDNLIDLDYACPSETYSSQTTFPVLHNVDEELYCSRARVQDSTVSFFQFSAAGDSNISVCDSSNSVVRSSTDVVNNLVDLHVEDDFSHGKNVTSITKVEDRHVSDLCHSVSDSQLHDGNEHCDGPDTNFLSYSTFLSCTKDLSARVSALSLLASRVKALCKMITARVPKDDAKILKMALYSTRLREQSNFYPQGFSGISDILVADVRIAFGRGETKMAARHSAHSHAIAVLQEPYLHLQERSDEILTLVGSHVPSITESYDVVAKLNVTSSDCRLPVLDVVTCGKQHIDSDRLNQLIDTLNHITSNVRTILHVLTNVRDKDVIDTAVHCANVPTYLQISNEQPFCGSMFIDGVLVASMVTAAKTDIRQCVYAAAVEVFCKPYLRLDGSWSSGPVRLLGSEEPFVGKASHILPPLQNDELDQQKMTCTAGRNGSLPNSNACAQRARNNLSSAALLSTAALATSFHRLSGEVKALFSDTATAKSATTIVTLALKATNLSSYTYVVPLKESCGYCCRLHVASVLVATGEAAGKTEATDEAYTNAAKLLQKPYKFRLVNLSLMIVGLDEPLIDIESQHTPETALSSPVVIDPFFCQKPENAKGCSTGMLATCAENFLLSETDSNVKCQQRSLEGCHFADTSVAEVCVLKKKHMPNTDSSLIVSASSELPYSLSTLPDQSRVSDTSSRSGVQSQTSDDALSEQKPNTVVIAGSEKELFLEMFLEPDDAKVNSPPSTSFRPNSSIITADEEDKEDLPPSPHSADLSWLVACFHRFACRVKAISESKVPIINSVRLIDKALAKIKMCPTESYNNMYIAGAGFCCDLSVGGVEISSGNGPSKKKSKTCSIRCCCRTAAEAVSAAPGRCGK